MPGKPYEYVFQDNRTYMYTDAPHCPGCTRVLDRSYIAPDFEFAGPAFDISMTSDGCLVASDRFISACVAITGLRFRPIPSLLGFSIVEVQPTIRLDEFENRIRKGVDCPACGHPRFVVHEGPLTLEPDEVLPTGFSRSELEFGDSADFGPDYPIRLNPVIASDEATVLHLKSAGLSGIHVIAPL